MREVPALSKMLRAGDIDCPNCALRLTPYQCDGKVLDKCDRCHGMWFDAQEIAVFRRALGRFNYARFKVEIEIPPRERRELFECPRCPSEALLEGAFARNDNIHVHVCQRCRGMWATLRDVVELVRDARDHRSTAQPRSRLRRTLQIFW